MLLSCSGPTRGGAADMPLRGPQESRGPMNLNVQNGNAIMHKVFIFIYNFIPTILCKLIG